GFAYRQAQATRGHRRDHRFCIAASAFAAEIKIEIVVPMTGQEASEGQDMENAIKLAIANLNATGGVLRKTITTVSADNACDPRSARPNRRARLLPQAARSHATTGRCGAYRGLPPGRQPGHSLRADKGCAGGCVGSRCKSFHRGWAMGRHPHSGRTEERDRRL